METEVMLLMPTPDKPWSTNEDRNLHPMERSKRIKAWKEATLFHYKSVYRGGPLPPSIITVHIPFKDRRKRDPHNYCGTVVKAVIDGLVRAGAWPDDTPEYVGHREPVLYKGVEVMVEINPR